MQKLQRTQYESSVCITINGICEAALNYNFIVCLIMRITSQNAVNQALAIIKLESLSLSEETMGLVNRALKDSSIDTTYIIYITP